MRNFLRNIRGSLFWKCTLTFLMVICLVTCSVVCYIPGVKAEDAENISSEESIAETTEDDSEESIAETTEDGSEEDMSETSEDGSEESMSETVEDSSEESESEVAKDSSEEGISQSDEDSFEESESETTEDSSDGSISLYADGSSAAKYDRSYNISDILSQFQYFTSGNVTMDSGGHTVGPIVVGGELDLNNSFGDVSLVPSYVAHLKNVGFYNASTGVEGTNNRIAYYADSAIDIPEYPETKWIQNPDYINLGTAFSAIKLESQNLAANSTKISAIENVVTIDCTKDTNVYVVMDYDTFSSAQSINIKVDGVDWFNNHICSISVTGVGSKEITYNGNGGICVNGTGISNQLKSMPGGVYSDQANLEGMNLVWNFPDATGEITVMGLGGHLVAPLAPVNLAGGNYEGGIIAASLTGGAEGHFYPMNKILKTSAGTTGSGDDNNNGDDNNKGDDANKGDDSNKGDDTNKGDDSNKGDDANKGDDSNKGGDTTGGDTTGGATGGETTGGTTGSTTTGGDSTTGNGGATGNDSTTGNGSTTGGFGNATGGSTDNAQKGSLEIVVTDEKTGAAVSNATVTVTDPAGNQKDFVTDNNGTIIIDDLDPGIYDITVKEVPDGYTVTTGHSAEALVEAGKVTHHEALILSASDTGTGTGTSNSVSSNSQVQTGDTFRIGVPVGLILISLLGIVLVTIPRKKYK